MSSYINTIKINNIISDINQIQDEIATLVVAGVPVVHGDVDLNNHSITETASVVYTNGDTLTNDGSHNLNWNSSKVLTASNVGTSINTDVSLQNHNLSGVTSLTLTGGGVLQFPFGDANRLTVQSDDLLRYGTDVVATQTFTEGQYFKKTADTDLDMNGHNITDSGAVITGVVQINDASVSGKKTNFITYAGILSAMDASNQATVCQYLCAPQLGGGLLNLNTYGYPLTNSGGIQFVNSGRLLTESGTNLVYNSQSMASQPFTEATYFKKTADSDLNLNNNDITNATTVNFGSGKVLSVPSTDLAYNSSTILTEANYAGIIPNNYHPTGGDIDMQNHSILNINTLDFGADKVVSVDDNDNLLFRNEPVVLQTGTQHALYCAIGDINMSFNAVQPLSNNTYTSSQVDFNNDFRFHIEDFSYDCTANRNYYISIKCYTDGQATIPAFTNGSAVLIRFKTAVFTVSGTTSGQFTGDFSFNKSTALSANVLLNNLGTSLVSSSNYTFTLNIETDATSDLINGVCEFQVFFSEQITTPLTLSVVNSALRYNNVQVLDTNYEFPQITFTDDKVLASSSGVLTYDSKAISSPQTIKYYTSTTMSSASSPYVYTIVIPTNCDNYISGVILAESFLIKFSLKSQFSPTSDQSAYVEDLSIVDLNASSSNDKFGSLTFTGIENSPNLNMGLYLQNTFGYTERIVIKMKVFSNNI